MGQRAHHLQDLLDRDSRVLDADAFSRRYEGFYLVGHLPVENTGEARKTFTTNVVAVDLAALTAPARQGPPFLFRIIKHTDGPFRGRISVGRARNNDIVLRHSTVSKLHAHFRLATSHDGQQALFVADVGSANETVVNGDVLARDEWAPLYPDDIVCFGIVECRVVDADGLYQRLKTL